MKLLKGLAYAVLLLGALAAFGWYFLSQLGSRPADELAGVMLAPPPGYAATGSPRWINQGGPWKAPITIHVIETPTPFAMAKAFSFNGVTPYADAYQPKNTDAPDELQYALRNAPPGATVNGAVYWQVYRALVTNVVLLDRQTGEHLAQWNIWQPGAPLP